MLSDRGLQKDILGAIIERRRSDIAEKGFSYGFPVPAKRIKPVLPFLPEKGVILEIKRASPSKGFIAELNAAETAKQYTAAGAAAISVLTEPNWFRGSLEDIVSVAKAVPNTPVLRKDFLFDEKEIDISWYCGADAVLLIARMLETGRLVSMVKRCAALGMTALIEVRLESDIEKLQKAIQAAPESVVAGVNARDLKDFSIDPLKPARMLPYLHTRTVYESGIRTAAAAAGVAGMGFHGILIGETAARDPAEAAILVRTFTGTQKTAAGAFWLKMAGLMERHTPLVKLCGFSQTGDTLTAAESGADLLGFVFSADSRRCVTADFVRQTAKALDRLYTTGKKGRPLLIGVVTQPESEEAQAAFGLVREGILDAIQYHGCSVPGFSVADRYPPGYAALAVGTPGTEGTAGDLARFDKLIAEGQPRILADAKAAGAKGGTGQCIDGSLISEIRKRTTLWLAGGITPGNAADLIRTYRPELIDVASGIETEPGIKDSIKMRRLLASVRQCAEK